MGKLKSLSLLALAPSLISTIYLATCPYTFLPDFSYDSFIIANDIDTIHQRQATQLVQEYAAGGSFRTFSLSTVSRAVYPAYRLNVVYHSEDNLLQPTHIARIRFLEQQILATPLWQTNCLLSGQQCVLPSSVINFMYPSVRDNSTYVFDGQGNTMGPPLDVALGMAETGITGFFDRGFSVQHPSSKTVISSFQFAVEPPGYAEQYAQVKQAMTQFLSWSREASSDQIMVLVSGGNIAQAEVNEILLKDLRTVLISFAVVVVYLVFHTKSATIVIFSLLMIAASFPVSLALYIAMFGTLTMSLMNCVAVWLLLAIGTDDVLMFFDRWQSFKDEGEGRLVKTWKSASSAIFVTSFTTAAGFLSLMVSPLAPLKQFGWFLAVTVVVHYFLVIAILPCVVLWQDDKRWCRKNPPPPPAIEIEMGTTPFLFSYPSIVSDEELSPSEEPSSDRCGWLKNFPYAHWVKRLRHVIVILFVVTLIIFATKIPQLESPQGLPQILPVNSNIEQLRTVQRELACATCLYGVEGSEWQSSSTPTTCPIEVCGGGGDDGGGGSDPPPDSTGCEDIHCGEFGFCHSPGECTCEWHHHGPRCEIAEYCSTTTEESCGLFGTCIDSTQQCVCDLGWSGYQCEVHDNECDNVDCSNHGTCSNVDGHCMCYDPWTGPTCNEQVVMPSNDDDNDNVVRRPISAELSVQVEFYFTGENFDFNDSDTRTMLYNFGVALLTDSRVRSTSVRCVIVDFYEWWSQASGVPIDDLLLSFESPNMLKSYISITFEHQKDVGFNSETQTVKYVRFSTRTYTDQDAGLSYLLNEYNFWQEWMSGVDNGFHTSSSWLRMKTESAFISGTGNAIIITMVVIMVSIFVFTSFSVILTALSTLAIGSVLVVLLGCFSIWGWGFGALEALAVPLIAGLSCDYVLHFVHAYNIADPSDSTRVKKVNSALHHVGLTLLAASGTTIVCLWVLWFCDIVLFVRFGIIAVTALTTGIILALVVLPAILMIIGPQKKFNVSLSRCLMLVRKNHQVHVVAEPAA